MTNADGYFEEEKKCSAEEMGSDNNSVGQNQSVTERFGKERQID